MLYSSLVLLYCFKHLYLEIKVNGAQRFTKTIASNLSLRLKSYFSLNIKIIFNNLYNRLFENKTCQ